MTRTRIPSIAAALLALALAVVPAVAEGPSGPLGLTVRAGRHPRRETPLRFEFPGGRLAEAVRKALEAGPVALEVIAVDGEGRPSAPPGGRSIAQVEKIGDGPQVRATWVLPGEVPAEGEARFQIGVDAVAVDTGQRTWTLAERSPSALELRYGDRPVFRYNAAPVSSPNYQAIQDRDAYIHPAYTPSGALITGDFSPYHPHHRGFFLAYVHTRSGDLTPDFWNIQAGSGKVHAEGFDRPVVGPVSARFSARHRWDARDRDKGTDRVVLRERWDVEAYAIAGPARWLFDLTSTQEAVDRPLELLPYRYGGMAYRGPEPFVKGTLDVLTSEGRHRRDGDQKPTRWVDLTGPVADGSETYAGAMIADHPANPHSPTVARIHPTTLPFFTYVPAHDDKLSLPADSATVFRYRIMIHDGHPDPALDERIWRDFAEPPTVVVGP